jgi:hypothetical protein
MTPPSCLMATRRWFRSDQRLTVVLSDEALVDGSVDQSRKGNPLAGAEHPPENDLDRRLHLLDARLVGKVANHPPGEQVIREDEPRGEIVLQVGRIEEGPEHPSLVIACQDDLVTDRAQRIAHAPLDEAGHERPQLGRPHDPLPCR